MRVYEAYGYLRNIIAEGFITYGLGYKDFDIVLKSLTDKEMQYLKIKNNKEDFSGVPLLDKLVYSTYFINGKDCLLDRSNNLEKIENYYNRLPAFVLTKISKKMDMLFEIFVESSRFLDGFCFTPESRALWSIFKSNSHIGLNLEISNSYVNNVIKERWVVANTQLDKEDSEENNLDLALFVASAFNPKGVKSTANSIKMKRDEKRKERDEIAKFGFSKRRIAEKRKVNKWSKPLVTNEDLVRELNKVQRGKKDRHDLFIDEWMRRKSVAAENKIKAQEEAASKYRKEYEEVSLDVEGSRKASQEEVQKMVDKGKDKKLHLDSFSSAYADIGKSEEFIKKIGSRVLKGEK